MTTLLIRPLSQSMALHRSPSVLAVLVVSATSNRSLENVAVLAKWKSTVAASPPDTNAPELVKVPTLPFLGSLYTRYSGTPKHSTSNVHEFWPEMRRRFGDFYSFGMFGLGAGWHGTLHVIQDPFEMAKLLRKEGQYPAGSAEYAWAAARYFDARNISAGSLIKNGAEWKRIRNFVQTDLLSPASAQRYLPAALEAAESISRGAPYFSDRMNEYLNIASFDMFSNIMLGHLPRVSDPTTETDPQDERFCYSVAHALRMNSKLMRSAYDHIMVKMLDIETSLYKEFESHFDESIKFAKTKVKDLKQKREKGLLTPAQEGCYVNQAYERQLNDDSITLEETEDIVGALITAGVDTTGGMLSWKMLFLASHPHVQERLYEEIVQTTKNGKLTEESVSTAKVPYLHAFMREAHRLGNPVPTAPIKKFPEPVDVHGVTLPAGSVVALDGISQGLDPELVEDPMKFRPERFLKEAVLARKGTPSEVIDHAFFNGPFSQGARKCPGSRVASMEACVLIAQLVLDWKMKMPTVQHWSEIPYDLDTLTTARLPRIEFTPRN